MADEWSIFNRVTVSVQFIERLEAERDDLRAQLREVERRLSVALNGMLDEGRQP